MYKTSVLSGNFTSILFLMRYFSACFFRSIPYDQLEKINSQLESDVMVRAIHDVKGIDMGNFLVRYKAEIDFDGRELTRSYLDKQDLQLMLNVSYLLKIH